METREQGQALHVVGIELRTRNTEAMQTIPAHWQRFQAEGVMARIPARTSDDVFGVYTHFEHAGRDNEGLYSLVIGACVPADAEVPAGMVRVVVPASRRAVFPVDEGRPDRVGDAWQEIWRTPLPKTFIADYEHYHADGRIEILIGVEREAATA